MKIIGIAGSLRAKSFNAGLLKAAVELAPPEMTIEPASIRGIPLYDGDLEAAHHTQNAWLPVLRTLRTRPWFGPPMLVSGAAKLFDEAGTLVDEDVRRRLRDFLAGYGGYIRSLHP